MKLIELYIENFGGLSRYGLDFEAGITTVTEPNGFGKTTLAEFIRAMFYGFPRKSKTLEKSLRQKYAPWNGGQYGGNLTFEHQGRRYRIERTFGANPKADTFSVIDLAENRKTNRFTEEIGQEIFSLDAESFERSTYLPQAGTDGELATASILSKLSNLVEDSADVGSYDKALTALRAVRSAMIPYRGSGGTVAETAAQITREQLQLDALREKENRLETVQQETAAVRQETEEIEKQLAQTVQLLQAASRQEADILRQQQYIQLQNRHRKVAEGLYFYKKKYPRGLPREDELRRAEITAERLRQRAKETAQGKAVPSRAQLDNCRRLCKTYGQLQEAVRDLQLQAARLPQAERANPASIWPVLLMAFAVAGLAAGGVMALLLDMVYGIALMGACALLLAAAWCIHSRKRRSGKRQAEEKRRSLQCQITASRERADRHCGEITAFFAGFDLHVQPQQFEKALNELESRRLSEAQQSGELAALEEELQMFFSGLGIAAEQNICGQLQQLRQDLRAVQTAGTLTRELEEQLAGMEETWGDILFAEFSALPEPEQLRREEQRLRAKLTDTTTRRLYLQQETKQLREAVSQLPAVRERLMQQQDKLEEQQKKVRILDATITFLQQAKENLATAYMGTIRTRFGQYLSMLEADGGNDYLIDSGLHVRLERLGQSRELAYFSAGQRDLVMLCMRLALADALFKEQEVLLILDDPFVNLDDIHMEKARKLLHALAPERQILYLTCHSSRTI